MATAREYCINALMDAGIEGDSTGISAESVNRALRTMNRLLGEWSAMRLLKGTLTSGSYTTSGASLTVGPTGNISTTTRPVQVESVQVSSDSGATYAPLRMATQLDYTQLATVSGSPCYYIYTPSASTASDGVVQIFPTPSGSYTYKVNYLSEFGDYGLNDEVNLPRELCDLLESGLTSRVARMFGFPRVDFDAEYQRILSVVMLNNVSFGKMRLSANLRTNRGSAYDL